MSNKEFEVISTTVQIHHNLKTTVKPPESGFEIVGAELIEKYETGGVWRILWAKGPFEKDINRGCF